MLKKIIVSSLIVSNCAGIIAETIMLSDKDAELIGKKIWHNECGGSVEKLIWWKEGEEFASLGIGHFIWFPEHCTAPFTQTFPELLSFLHNNGVVLPASIAPNSPCPWKTRAEFCNASHSPSMKELRTLLVSTIDLQTKFITQRFVATLPRILDTVSSHEQKKIQKQFFRVAKSPLGLYALIDYVNFKGEGINHQEKYNGQGWGLLQVLARMQGEEIGHVALQEFATTAKQILTERVAHAPRERNEQQWLQGWKNRVDTYAQH